jgi:Tol biopolymer transport system component
MNRRAPGIRSHAAPAASAALAVVVVLAIGCLLACTPATGVGGSPSDGASGSPSDGASGPPPATVVPSILASFPAWPTGSPAVAQVEGRITLVGYDDPAFNPAVYVFDGRDGTIERITGPEVYPDSVAWSPDGRSLALAHTVCPPDPCGTIISILDLDTGALRDVTSLEAGIVDGNPMFSPDGRRLVIRSNREAAGDRFRNNLFIVEVDGSSLARIPIEAPFVGGPAWSPDGEWIGYLEQMGSEPAQLAQIRPDGSGHNVILVDGQLIAGPTWSPDGHSMAFTRNGAVQPTASGELASWPEIWIAGSDGSGARPVLGYPASGGGPAWSQDGRTIAFVGGLTTERERLWLMTADGVALGMVPVGELTISSFARTATEGD